MKKGLKKILIVLLAVVCALSVHISVAAASTGALSNWEEFSRMMESLLNRTTTEPAPDNTTTTEAPPETTTADSNDNTVQNPVSQTGSAIVTTTAEPNTSYYYPSYTSPNSAVGNLDITTSVQTTVPEEESSTTFSASLTDLFEQDSAAVIVQQTPTEPFTIDSLVVKNDEDKGAFTWQTVALIAAAVLFAVLLALVVALLVQRSKNAKKDDESSENQVTDEQGADSPSGAVPVEVMTPERIAELLGTVSKNPGVSDNMTSEESAAAIKAAVLMGQLTNSYSDPLIRKYTEEPVMISPVANINLDEDDITGAQILEATKSMLDDFGADDKAQNSAGAVSAEEINASLDSNGVKTKICPECRKPVGDGDIFCHSCGNYVGG